MLTFNDYFTDLFNDAFKPYEASNSDDMSFDVPGFNKSNLSISLKSYYGSSFIHIKGKTETRSIDKYIRLRSHVKKENISVDIEDGVLTIKLQYSEDEEINLLK